MDKIKFDEVNLYDFGNEIQMSGTIWSGKGLVFITSIPDKEEDYLNLKVMPMSLSAWERLLRQVDTLETEIFHQDPTGITKTLVRKSQRQIDNFVQWTVFKRDNYHCRYCGRDGVPLTVDHVILWEDGGPTVEDNLITACRSCNKDRGRMPYQDWLNSDLYLKKSKDLPEAIKNENMAITLDLPRLESLKVQNIRSR